jgi:hypothetical protein
LTLKTSFLLALVTVKRPSDINRIHILDGYFQLSMHRLTAQPLGVGKTDRPSHIGPPIVVEAFLKEPQLCPVYYLNAYVRRTQKHRQPAATKLFLATRRPFAPVSPQTQARWLRELLALLGVVKPQARSVRSVGSSTAAQANLDISRIMVAADWSRLATFARHYFRPQAMVPLSVAILADPTSPPEGRKTGTKDPETGESP